MSDVVYIFENRLARAVPPSNVVHPAIIECRRLHDMERDCTNHETSFIQNVRRIVARTIETRRTAARLWGFECGAFRAACDLAKRQEEDDLRTALDRYNEFNAGRDEPCLFTMQL